MSGRGVDKTGRSTTKVIRFGKAKRWTFAEQFVGHPLSLRESPGFRALTMPPRRILDFLELEHMAHAGTENGQLLAPYKQLVAFGVSRRDICPGLDMLEAFGIIRRTERGERLEGRPKASKYALTWLPTHDGAQPTEDYRRVTAVDVVAFVREATLRRAQKAAQRGDIEGSPQTSTGISDQSSTNPADLSGVGSHMSTGPVLK